MKILAINAGSSSLKFTLLELPEEKVITSGNFERIGVGSSFYTFKFNGEKIKKEIEMANHEEAVAILMKELVDLNIITSLDEIEGVGHRVVHGGSIFKKSVVIDDEVIKNIEALCPLAPLHNPANLTAIKAFMKAMPTKVNTAVFDTAYHQTMDEEFYLYPVNMEWYEKYNVRKYGFHGTSHKFIFKSISEKLDNKNLRVISVHIGNGCSTAAIDSDKVVDTSMGFTPLAGLMMGTRSGDIDASILEYMVKESGKSLEELTSELNKKSGLLGVSGISSDARDIEDGALNGDSKCILAQNMYAQKVANYIAMYNNILGGADVICFTAGLGENAILMRELIADRITSLGVKLNKERNDIRGEFKLISSDDSSIPMYIVPTNEELMIALDTINLIK